MNSFLEITSNDNWFKQHPEKIAGVEYETTSFYFPIMVKGTKEDVLRVTGMSDNKYNSMEIDELVILKKKLYANVDIESPMSDDEKLLNKVIAEKYSLVNQTIKEKRIRLAKAKAKALKVKLSLGKLGISIDTEVFKKMTVIELKNYTLQYYETHLKGKKVTIENELKEVLFVGDTGRKLLKPIYSEKVAVLEHLEELIKNSTYNNFGERKETDSIDVLGFLNFKSKITIDKVKRHVRISVVLYKNRATNLKNYEIGMKKEKSGNLIRAAQFANPTDVLKSHFDTTNVQKKPIKKILTIKDLKFKAKAIKERDNYGSKAWELLEDYAKEFDNVYENDFKNIVVYNSRHGGTELMQIIKSDYFIKKNTKK